MIFVKSTEMHVLCYKVVIKHVYYIDTNVVWWIYIDNFFLATGTFVKLFLSCCISSLFAFPITIYMHIHAKMLQVIVSVNALMIIILFMYTTGSWCSWSVWSTLLFCYNGSKFNKILSWYLLDEGQVYCYWIAVISFTYTIHTTQLL